MRERFQKKITIGGVFGLPIIAVLGANIALSPPQVSSAISTSGTTMVDLSDSIDLDPPEVDARTRDAVMRDVELADASILTTPFYYRVIKPNDPKPVVVIDPAPEFEVGVILGASTGNIALIGGERRVVGDMMENWTIVDINPSERSVTIEHADGRRVTRSVELPFSGEGE